MDLPALYSEMVGSWFRLVRILNDSETLKSPLRQSCLISCVPQSREHDTVTSTCWLKAPCLTEDLGKRSCNCIYARCTFYVMRRGSGPSWFDNWSVFFVIYLHAPLLIWQSIFIPFYLFIPMFINTPFTCTDKFWSKKYFPVNPMNCLFSKICI